MSSEFARFTKNFIKEVRSIMDQKVSAAPPNSSKWRIKKETRPSRPGGNTRFETTNPFIDGMKVTIRFGSDALSISQMNYHIGWSGHHTIQYADPTCTPARIADLIAENPDGFIVAWLACKEEADDFNLESR